MFCLYWQLYSLLLIGKGNKIARIVVIIYANDARVMISQVWLSCLNVWSVSIGLCVETFPFMERNHNISLVYTVLSRILACFFMKSGREEGGRKSPVRVIY
jgi:hypothetical protein